MASPATRPEKTAITVQSSDEGTTTIDDVVVAKIAAAAQTDFSLARTQVRSTYHS